MPIKIGEKDYKHTLENALERCFYTQDGKEFFNWDRYSNLMYRLGFEIIDFNFEGDCQDYAFTKIGFPEFGFKNYGSVQRELINGRVPGLKQTETFSDGNLIAYYYRDFEYDIEEHPTPYVHYGILREKEGNFFVESKFGKGNIPVIKHPLNYFYHGNYIDMYQLR